MSVPGRGKVSMSLRRWIPTCCLIFRRHSCMSLHGGTGTHNILHLHLLFILCTEQGFPNCFRLWQAYLNREAFINISIVSIRLASLD